MSGGIGGVFVGPFTDLSIAYVWTGQNEWTQPLRAPAGSQGAPGLTFGDTDTGFWRPATDKISISTNNIQIMRWDANIGPIIRSDYYLGWASDSVFTGTDFFLSRGAAATLQLGGSNAASPVAQTVQGQGSRAGTDSNVGGANLSVRSGNGTGTGTLASLLLQSPVAVASGTGAQTQTTGLEIKNGTAKLTSYAVAGLPSAATSGAGAMIYVSNEAGGAVPAFSDGTDWRRVTDRAIVS